MSITRDFFIEGLGVRARDIMCSRRRGIWGINRTELNGNDVDDEHLCGVDSPWESPLLIGALVLLSIAIILIVFVLVYWRRKSRPFHTTQTSLLEQGRKQSKPNKKVRFNPKVTYYI